MTEQYPERLYPERFYYVEKSLVEGFSVSVAMALFGILLNINLDDLGGELVLIISVLFGMISLITASQWYINPNAPESDFLQNRKRMLAIKMLLFLALVGVSIYMIVILFQANGQSVVVSPVF
jgi:predicted membrane channel-forming protein YqfA (hemolysin III family)